MRQSAGLFLAMCVITNDRHFERLQLNYRDSKQHRFYYFFITLALIMRPSSLGGGRIFRRTLSVCLSVCLSVRLSVRPVIVAMGDVFSAPLASRRAT